MTLRWRKLRLVVRLNGRWVEGEWPPVAPCFLLSSMDVRVLLVKLN